jgi:hypothetical protein
MICALPRPPIFLPGPSIVSTWEAWYGTCQFREVLTVQQVVRVFQTKEHYTLLHTFVDKCGSSNSNETWMEEGYGGPGAGAGPDVP